MNKIGSSDVVASDITVHGFDFPDATRVIQFGIAGGTEQYIILAIPVAQVLMVEAIQSSLANSAS